MSRILIVDDDAGVLRLLASLFEDEGWDVDAASGGTQALQMLESAPPAVILLDLMMPGISGEEVIGELHSRGLEVPVVVMSARQNVAEVAEVTRAAGYLAKPFDIEDALTMVSQYAQSA